MFVITTTTVLVIVIVANIYRCAHNISMNHTAAVKRRRLGRMPIQSGDNQQGKSAGKNSDEKAAFALDQLGKGLGRTVTIEDELNEETFAKCNHQQQSSFFTKLPREIRNLIYEYATSQYVDETQKYDPSKFYYRPGHTARLKTDTNILLTCRRVWLEANPLPMLQAEQCFWRFREAPDGREKGWMASLTPNNRKNFGHLHVFAQMYAIEGIKSDAGELRKYFLEKAPIRSNDFQPRSLHVTIRHTDWWHWEREQQLEFKDSWVQALLDSPDLRSTQTLKLELETLDYKVVQLRPIIERLQNLTSQEMTTHLVDGVSTTTKFVLQGEPDFHEWSGPTNVGGLVFPQYQRLSQLTYHVFTLTWVLQFPQLGRVRIAEMRKAPRIERQGRVRPSSPTPKRINRNDARKQREAQSLLDSLQARGSLIKLMEDDGKAYDDGENDGSHEN